MDEVDAEPNTGDVYSRSVKAHRHDTYFVNLTPQDICVPYNRVNRCLLSKVDMDYLDSINLVERAKQAQVMFSEV